MPDATDLTVEQARNAIICAMEQMDAKGMTYTKAENLLDALIAAVRKEAIRERVENLVENLSDATVLSLFRQPPKRTVTDLRTALLNALAATEEP